ncbi:6-bladed beta-propeller [Belliella aquatica]|uniref:6-bladed beta-propeller protein n=1 Tax=Belliella aquatica TaxID=1323734 RepID=A0ABQ1M5S5_9BACT|nr:6-bladed beta-propeller [Belliella aquatica]GGC33858.1 hypothetical protein GCM10010993_10870 [Belliella aquatica]
MERICEFLICYVILFGCSKSEESNEFMNTKLIDFKNVKNFDSLISPRDLMKDVEYIKFNTPDEFKLTSVSKIQEMENKLIVLDGKNNILIAFDSNGNYIAQVGKIGEGPEEYKEASDFDIDQNSNIINIFSRADHAILQFDSDLKFLKKIKLKNWASQFGVLESGNLALYSYLGEESNKFNISIYNQSGEVIDQKMMVNPSKNFIPLNYSGFINKEFYTYPLSSKIYKIKENQKEDSLVYLIDFPNKFEEKNIFDHGSYINPADKIKKNILSKFEIGDDGEFLCYYEFREGLSNGYTLGVRLSSGETFGHQNMHHAAKGKGDVFVWMFFTGPYSILSYSKESEFYYAASNIDVVAVYQDYITQRIKEKNVKDIKLLNLLEDMDLEEPVLMKFKLKKYIRTH